MMRQNGRVHRAAAIWRVLDLSQVRRWQPGADCHWNAVNCNRIVSSNSQHYVFIRLLSRASR